MSVGTCGRAFGTPCVHEHACVRCALLRPDPAQRGTAGRDPRQPGGPHHRSQTRRLARRSRRTPSQPRRRQRQARPDRCQPPAKGHHHPARHAHLHRPRRPHRSAPRNSRSRREMMGRGAADEIAGARGMRTRRGRLPLLARSLAFVASVSLIGACTGSGHHASQASTSAASTATASSPTPAPPGTSANCTPTEVEP